MNAQEVFINGKVIAESFVDKMPYYDKVFNFLNLFKNSSMSFNYLNRLINVSVPIKPSIAHWTYPLPLKVSGVANLYTLHDLVPLKLPYTTLDNKKKYFKLVSLIAKQADHIITVSESSKKDIIEFLGVDESRITNTYQSVFIPDKYRFKSSELVANEVDKIFGLPYKGFYLFWGSIEPKKNIGRLIEAFVRCDSKLPLIIVGAQSWKSDGELQLLKSFGLNGDHNKVSFYNGRIRIINYLPFSMLISLIKSAKATIFPSLYEGFGLPVLESMLLGTPVITSNTSSLIEVAGDAALYVDPYDVESLIKAINLMDKDSDIGSFLSEKGLKQADKFSIKNYNNKLRIYESFL